MSNKSVNVVCLKWGTKYDAYYVNVLYTMVRRHLLLPHRFFCITDNPVGLDEGITILPLITEPGLKGWWYKLSLFRGKIYGDDLVGTTLFLDLDVVIQDTIDCLFDYDSGGFIILKDWAFTGDIWNSSVFRIEIGDHKDVWKDFVQDKHQIMRRLHGDQDWISEKITNPKIWPSEWIVSFKHHCDPEPPADAKIVVFHGDPKPDEAKANFISEHWWYLKKPRWFKKLMKLNR